MIVPQMWWSLASKRLKTPGLGVTAEILNRSHLRLEVL